MTKKEFFYITILSHRVSYYATYWASLTAQREGSWSATGCVRRVYGAPYITSPLATSEYRLKQLEIST